MTKKRVVPPAKEDRLHVRVEASERALWEEHAKAEGITLCEWVRKAARLKMAVDKGAWLIEKLWGHVK